MKRILVIDDNRDTADLLVSILELEGYSAKAEYGGSAALHVLSEYRPHIVFLDISMPDLNGFDVAARIRKSHVKQPYMIAFSALSDPATIARTVQVGFNQHIAKTSTFDILMRAVREAAGKEQEKK